MIFDGYLESQINIVYILWGCIVVWLSKVSSKVIGGLLRYRGMKLVWKGPLYKGYVKGALTKVDAFM